MKLEFKTIYVKKQFPLTISRGVLRGSENLFVNITIDGISGWGEIAGKPRQNEHDKANEPETPEFYQQTLRQFCEQDFADFAIAKIYDLGIQQQIPPYALAGLDIALWDWLGKKANLPLYQLLGSGKPTVATSVTIGINSPEVVRERVPLLLHGTGIRALKLKLGSPLGIEADQAMYAQVVECAANYDVKLRVDANGGWSVDAAIDMMKWLAEKGCEYVEQPLRAGQEAELPRIYRHRPLPIYVDESCRFSRDIPQWAHCVDGVNLKLMKCGGITEALRIIAVARAHGLKTMIGCMGESSIAISAAAAITGLIDHIDLDSHLNLDPDPSVGATLQNGIIMPNDHPGHGAALRSSALCAPSQCP